MLNGNDYVSLKDIWYGMLKMWKIVLIGALVFAVLFSALKYKRDMGGYRKTLSEVDNSDLSAQISQDDLLAVNEYMILEDKISAFRTYLNSNARARMNPYDQEVYRIQYYIKTSLSNSEETQKIASDLGFLYQQNLLTENIISQISKTFHCTEEDVLGLVDVSCYGSDSILNIDLIASDNCEIDTNTFTQSMKGIISDVYEILNEVYQHELIFVSASNQIINNSVQAQEQVNLITQIQSLENIANTQKSKWSDAQREYFDLLAAQSDHTEDATVIPEKPGINLKYAAAGFFAGGFLMCFIAIFLTLSSNKILNPEVLIKKYGLRLYGTVIGNPTLLKIPHNFSSLPLHNLISLIELDCKKNGLSAIHLIGTEISKINTSIISEIKSKLADGGITLEAAGDITRDTKALEKCAYCNNIILVEKLYESKSDMIAREFELFHDYKINVLSTFVICDK